mgnify:CR=1
MPNGIMNWTFDDVVVFLKKHNFVYNYTKGSHYFYIGSKGGVSRQVSVPFHGRKAINPKTVASIIRQSGIAREDWLN